MTTLDTTTLTTLLRSPRSIADSIGRGTMLRPIALTSLAAIAVGMGVYGGVVGSVRGSTQIAFAAIKMPIVAMITLSLLAPAVAGASRAFELEMRFDRATALVLAATARAALVLLALAPVVSLFTSLNHDYHDRILLAVSGFAAAGLAGLPILWHGIPRGPGRLVLAAFVLVGFGIVSAQSAWVLRPWITRPTSAITFLRAPEGAVGVEVMRASRSASGHYDAPRPEASRSGR